jgi:hypothetical protein
VGATKGLQLVMARGVTGVTFGSNLLSQRAGFRFGPKLHMVQFEVTSKAQTYVLARLLRIGMIQGKDAMPAHTNGCKTRVFDVFGVRCICIALVL